MLALLALVGLASATHVATFEVNARWTDPPFAGMESLVVDPAGFLAQLQPVRGPLPPEVEALRNEAPAGQRQLAFTNPMNNWADLKLNGTPVGTLGPYSTLKLDGVRYGTYTIELRVPTGFVRTFAVKVVPPSPKAGGPVAVTVGQDRLDLSDKVHFEFDSAVLLSQSHALLDAVAKALAAHPDVLLVRVEGHTDSLGDADYNQKLSDARAAAVREYLVKAGVAADRLTSVGLGESKLLDPADTDAAHDTNRRVELLVEKRQEAAPPVEATTGKGKKKGGK